MEVDWQLSLLPTTQIFSLETLASIFLIKNNVLFTPIWCRLWFFFDPSSSQQYTVITPLSKSSHNTTKVFLTLVKTFTIFVFKNSKTIHSCKFNSLINSSWILRYSLQLSLQLPLFRFQIIFSQLITDLIYPKPSNKINLDLNIMQSPLKTKFVLLYQCSHFSF